MNRIELSIFSSVKQTTDKRSMSARAVAAPSSKMAKFPPINDTKFYF